MMVSESNLVVAGDPGLARKLRDTRCFPAVFDVDSATQLRALSKSRRVHSPAAFLFAPGFHEDVAGAGVPLLANRLSGIGFPVLVHAFFTGRGDVFEPRVTTAAAPMKLSDLLTALGVVPAESRPRPPKEPDVLADLHPEPLPTLWTAPG